MRPRCEACGLDFRFADVGDGPMILVMLFGGYIVLRAALLVEVMFRPPYWVHAAPWGPLVLPVTLAPLRSMKGLLIALQFHHEAAEGRHARRSGS